MKTNSILNVFGFLHSLIYYFLSAASVLLVLILAFITLKSGWNFFILFLFLIPLYLVYLIIKNTFIIAAKSPKEFKKLSQDFDEKKFYRLFSKNVGTIILTFFILLISSFLILMANDIKKSFLLMLILISCIPTIISGYYIGLIKKKFKSIIKNAS